MRAREPDEQGYVEREGVRIGYETFGFDGPGAADRPAVVFVPIDTIVHSRAWKGQVPYLSQHYRVVTIDPRGQRPHRIARPTRRPTTTSSSSADTIAVMDHLGLERAMLVGICLSAWHAILVAHFHPDRVQGLVAVAPVGQGRALPRTPGGSRPGRHFDEELRRPTRAGR